MKKNRMSQSQQQARGSRSIHRLLLGTLLFALGCGQEGDLSLASVEGSVAYGGKLLNHGKVVFSPQSGTPGPIAYGNIQPDGSFVMQTTGYEGAVVGLHKVTVHCRRALTPAEIKNRSLETPESLIPDKYWKHKESTLTFEVEAGEDHEYEIVLE